MTQDPFRIAGPAIISFSGGRTSAYMLWRILQAYGGTLPDDVLCVFSNTGREMPATLDFVRDCGAAWNVPIRWLEYRRDPETGAASAEEVSHNSASRAGEPFEQMLGGKKMLPNPVMRFCTGELKVKTVARWARTVLGWERWANAVGLRADEPRRVAKNRLPKRERWSVILPLADAGITKADVLAFWRVQPFDLRLAGPWEGTERAFRSTIPTKLGFNTFRADRPPYAALAQLVRDQGTMLLDETMIEGGEACDGGCGI